MKTRIYMTGMLIVLSAFLTAFVITAQEDTGLATLEGLVAAAPAPAPALDPAAPAPAPATGLAVEVPAATDNLAGIETVELSPPTGSGKTTVSKTDDNKISITLDDVEMVDVVRMFTKISNANILSNPTNLRGRVTVNLTDVEWKPAMESILDMHGLQLKEQMPGSAVYSIVSKPVGAPDPLVVQTYFLKYATVAEVQGLLTPVIGQGGTIAPFVSRNALVVRTTTANHGAIKLLIEGADKKDGKEGSEREGGIDTSPRKQVFIEAKFMELNDEATRNLGVKWQPLDAYSVGIGGMNWSMNETRNWADTRSDTMKQSDTRTSLDHDYKMYDMNGVQGEESTTTYEESPPGSGNWASITKKTPTRTITDDINRSLSYDQSIGKTFDKTIADIRTAVLGIDDFNLVLSALKQMNGVSIISNPKIIVANEQTALIHIGTRERPFVSTITPATTTSAPIVTYNPGDPVDLGVKLTVTPTVHTTNEITLKIEPELTRWLRDAVAPNGQTYPVIATKRISTVFCLQNGKTVAIGGLTETEDRDTESKIPLLGDIPIIGKYLFSHSSKKKGQTETIIFVTIGLATPGDILEKDGLPQDTELAHQHLLSSELQKAKFKKDMEEMQKTATEKEERGATIRSRLLRRRI